jgi:hypothetical protein
MTRTDKFRLGRYFRNVESVSWDFCLAIAWINLCKTFIIYAMQQFILSVLAASVFGTDVFH